MNFLAKYLFQVIATSCILIVFAPYGSAVQWDPASQSRPLNSARVTLVDSNTVLDGYSAIRVIRIAAADSQIRGRDLSLCRIWGEEPCTNEFAKSEAFTFSANVTLPLCKNELFEYCVKSVEIYGNENEKADVENLGITKELQMDGYPDVGLPFGSGMQLFRAPNVKNSGGTDTYALRAQIQFNFDKSLDRFVPAGFSVVVLPYSQVASTGGRPPALRAVNSSPEVIRSLEPELVGMKTIAQKWYAGDSYIDGRLPNAGFHIDENYVGLPEDFNANTRVKVAVLIPASLGGWFSGRLKDPEIQLSTISPQVNLLSLSAQSSEVSRLSAVVPADKFTPQMLALNMRPSITTCCGGYSIESGYDTGTKWVEELRPFVNDKAVASTNVWVLRKSPEEESKCFPKNQFNGLVTTNATAYSWNPPVFRDGFLDYQVAGLHFDDKGELSLGTYDLILSSSVARCLYGFTQAPISATISVISSSGDSQNVAATFVSEKDGWLKLAAYGFTFSSPTLRVKIEQKVVTTESDRSAQSSAVSKGFDDKTVISKRLITPKKMKQVITCSKNGKIRKFSGVKPKCPSGYRKI